MRIHVDPDPKPRIKYCFVGAWPGPPTSSAQSIGEHPLWGAINAPQLVIEPGTSCTAGEHSMQRTIRTALLSTISEPQLYYYSFMILNLFYCVQNGEDFESMVQGMVQETAFQSPQLAQQVISHLSLN